MPTWFDESEFDDLWNKEYDYYVTQSGWSPDEFKNIWDGIKMEYHQKRSAQAIEQGGGAPGSIIDGYKRASQRDIDANTFSSAVGGAVEDVAFLGGLTMPPDPTGVIPGVYESVTGATDEPIGESIQRNFAQYWDDYSLNPFKRFWRGLGSRMERGAGYGQEAFQDVRGGLNEWQGVNEGVDEDLEASTIKGQLIGQSMGALIEAPLSFGAKLATKAGRAKELAGFVQDPNTIKAAMRLMDDTQLDEFLKSPAGRDFLDNEANRFGKSDKTSLDIQAPEPKTPEVITDPRRLLASGQYDMPHVPKETVEMIEASQAADDVAAGIVKALDTAAAKVDDSKQMGMLLDDEVGWVNYLQSTVDNAINEAIKTGRKARAQRASASKASRLVDDAASAGRPAARTAKAGPSASDLVDDAVAPILGRQAPARPVKDTGASASRLVDEAVAPELAYRAEPYEPSLMDKAGFAEDRLGHAKGIGQAFLDAGVRIPAAVRRDIPGLMENAAAARRAEMADALGGMRGGDDGTMLRGGMNEQGVLEITDADLPTPDTRPDFNLSREELAQHPMREGLDPMLEAQRYRRLSDPKSYDEWVEAFREGMEPAILKATAAQKDAMLGVLNENLIDSIDNFHDAAAVFKGTTPSTKMTNVIETGGIVTQSKWNLASRWLAAAQKKYLGNQNGVWVISSKKGGRKGQSVFSKYANELRPSQVMDEVEQFQKSIDQIDGNVKALAESPEGLNIGNWIALRHGEGEVSGLQKYLNFSERDKSGDLTQGATDLAEGVKKTMDGGILEGFNAAIHGVAVPIREVWYNMGGIGRMLYHDIQNARVLANSAKAPIMQKIASMQSYSDETLTEIRMWMDGEQIELDMITDLKARADAKWLRAQFNEAHGAIETTGLNVDYIKDYFPHMWKPNKTQRYVGPVAARVKAYRNSPRLETGYNEDVLEVLSRYFSDVSDDLAFRKVFGKGTGDIETISETVFKAAGDAGHTANQTKFLKATINKIQKYDPTMINPKVDKVGKFIREFETITKLPLAGIRNLSQSGQTSLMTSATDVVNAMKKYHTGGKSEMVKYAEDMGALGDSIIFDIIQPGTHTPLTRTVGKMLNATWFNKSEAFNRVISAWAGKDWINGAAQKLVKLSDEGKLATGDGKFLLDRLDRMGVNPGELIQSRGKVTPHMEAMASNWVTQNSQFYTRGEEMSHTILSMEKDPTWSPYARTFLTQFKSFPFKNMASLYHNVLKASFKHHGAAGMIEVIKGAGVIAPFAGMGTAATFFAQVARGDYKIYNEETQQWFGVQEMDRPTAELFMNSMANMLAVDAFSRTMFRMGKSGDKYGDLSDGVIDFMTTPAASDAMELFNGAKGSLWGNSEYDKDIFDALIRVAGPLGDPLGMVSDFKEEHLEFDPVFGSTPMEGAYDAAELFDEKTGL